MRKILILLIIVMCLPFISAGVNITNDKQIYGYGDILTTSATITAEKNSADYLQLNLICDGGNELNFFKRYLLLDNGQQEILSESILLAKSSIRDLTGECYVNLQYESFGINSETFTISNKINIEIFYEEEHEPGETITISGTAFKETEEVVDAFVDISIPDTDIQRTEYFEGGEFSIDIELPEDMPAGSYDLNIDVYQIDEKTDYLNEGSVKGQIKILQIPKTIEFVVSNQEIDPGDVFKFKTLLYDQTESEITDQTLAYKIKNTENRIIEEGETSIDNFVEYQTETSASAGYWTLEITTNSISDSVEFIVNENEEASFEVLNDTLIVTNIGNIPYEEEISIIIGSDIKTESVMLDVGQKKEFELNAPDGVYDIKVYDSKNTVEKSSVALTGRAVDIKKISDKDSSGVFSMHRRPASWIFIFIILGAFIAILINKGNIRGIKTFKPSFNKLKSKLPFTKSKKTGLESMDDKGIQEPTKIDLDKTKDQKNIAPIPSPSSFTIKEAELSPIVHGPKHNANIVTLKIKNLSELKKKKTNALDNIKQAVSKEFEHKAIPYYSKDYIMLLLSPSVTKTFKNEKKAIKTAQEIEKALKKHNKLYKDKIDFGIAISSGEMITELQKETLKFASIGNTISQAKKLADISDKEVLLSENIHKKVMGEIKTSKIEKDNIKAYEIKQIIDRGEHKKFIRDFIKRTEQENKEK